MVHSGGFGIFGHKNLYNAKCGNLSVYDFAKLHAIHTPQGRMCSATGTPGVANDSPYLRKMIKNNAELFWQSVSR